MGNEHFYSELVLHRTALHRLLNEAKYFKPVPADWHVVVADIEGSSDLVLNGNHHTVNHIATASIVAVLNIIYAEGLEVPFFFGGDGATFILPGSIMQKCMAALRQLQLQVKGQHQYQLKTGSLPVSEITAAGHHIKIARVQTTALHDIPVVLGDGLQFAESKIKHDNVETQAYLETEAALNLDGMQCRWDRIETPLEQQEILSLIVMANNAAQQGKVYADVIRVIDEICGELKLRMPVSLPKLRILASTSKIKQVMKTRLASSKFYRIMGEWFTLQLVKLFLLTSGGRKYLTRLIDLVDSLVLDGKINTVLTCTSAQRKQLEKRLGKMEEDGQIIYAIHISKASVMSCYIRDIKDNHIHFIDGEDGGFTRAAMIFKNKLKRKN